MLETVQKVGWKDAVSSMDYASQYITTCEVAQNFVATYMQQIISILLDQDFVKLNSMAFERNCVEQSLQNAIKVRVDGREFNVSLRSDVSAFISNLTYPTSSPPRSGRC